MRRVAQLGELMVFNQTAMPPNTEEDKLVIVYITTDRDNRV